MWRKGEDGAARWPWALDEISLVGFGAGSGDGQNSGGGRFPWRHVYVYWVSRESIRLAHQATH